MSFKTSKCESCKKYILLDEAPWSACSKYPDCIPSKYFENTTDSGKTVECSDYEFDPDWQKRYDE